MKKPVKKVAAKKSPVKEPPKKKEPPKPVVITSPAALWFAFDTETTGLVNNRTLPVSRQPEVVEFYGVQFDPGSGKLYDELDQLIKPSKEMNAEQISHHGIDNEMLRHQPVFATVAPKIKKFIESQKLVLAHNLSFDMDMMEIEFQRLKQTIAWPKRMCTVEQTIHIKGHRLSLTKLHEYLFGEPFSGAHRAKVDVAALVRCICELHKRGIM